MADTRTVLHALPEDQPDELGKGTKSNSIHKAKPAKKKAAEKKSDDDTSDDS